MGTQVIRYRRKGDGTIESRAFDSDDLSPPWYDSAAEVPPLNPPTDDQIAAMSTKALRTYVEHRRRRRDGDEDHATLLAEARALTPPESPDAKPLKEMTNAELQRFISRQNASLEPAREREGLLAQAERLQADKTRLATQAQKPGKDDGLTPKAYPAPAKPLRDMTADELKAFVISQGEAKPAGDRDTLLRQAEALEATRAAAPAADKDGVPKKRPSPIGTLKRTADMTDEERMAYIRSKGETPMLSHDNLVAQAKRIEAGSV